MMQTSTNIIVAYKEVDGVEMGVFEDGVTFLTQRGLARACGVDPSAIIRQADAWKAGKRDGRLARLLQDLGYDEDLLYIPIDTDRGRIFAYTDSVFTVIVEYYALDVRNDTARQSLRVTSRQGWRGYIYGVTGYIPTSHSWQPLLDRLRRASAPDGYFSVLGEVWAFLSSATENGLPPNSKTVPDISVGLAWGHYWTANNLDAKYGKRRRHQYQYPSDYPQAKASPQKIWVYPEDALGEFRRWFRTVYGPNKLPTYLNRKCDQGQITRADADKLLAAVIPAQLAEGGNPNPMPSSSRTAPCRLLPAARRVGVVENRAASHVRR